MFHQTAGERAKEIDVPQRTLSRKADAFEKYGMQSLFASGEQGGARETRNSLPPEMRQLIAGEEVSVWVYESTLKIEYQTTALALFSVRHAPDQQITEVANPRRLETRFRSPQLDLWQLSDTVWLLALRRPEPAPRRNRGKIVALARQLPLPEVGATG